MEEERELCSLLVRSLAMQSSTVKPEMCSSCLVQDQRRKEQTGRLWLRSVVHHLSMGR